MPASAVTGISGISCCFTSIVSGSRLSRTLTTRPSCTSRLIAAAAPPTACHRPSPGAGSAPRQRVTSRAPLTGSSGRRPDLPAAVEDGRAVGGRQAGQEPQVMRSARCPERTDHFRCRPIPARAPETAQGLPGQLRDDPGSRFITAFRRAAHPHRAGQTDIRRRLGRPCPRIRHLTVTHGVPVPTGLLDRSSACVAEQRNPQARSSSFLRPSSRSEMGATFFPGDPSAYPAFRAVSMSDWTTHVPNASVRRS